MSAAVPGATGAPRLSVETALQQPMDLAAGAKPRKKRQAAPRREGDAWKSVTVLKEHETSPQLQCNNCGKTLDGEGGGRIREGRGVRRSKYANYSRIWRAELIRVFRIPHVGTSRQSVQRF